VSLRFTFKSQIILHYLTLKFKSIARQLNQNLTGDYLMRGITLLLNLSCTNFCKYTPKFPKLVSDVSTIISNSRIFTKSSVPVNALYTNENKTF
jgi:hypothetical protein